MKLAKSFFYSFRGWRGPVSSRFSPDDMSLLDAIRNHLGRNARSSRSQQKHDVGLIMIAAAKLHGNTASSCVTNNIKWQYRAGVDDHGITLPGIKPPTHNSQLITCLPMCRTGLEVMEATCNATCLSTEIINPPEAQKAKAAVY